MSARWDDATTDRLNALRAASGLPRMGAVELQDPDGVRGTLVGPAARLAEIVRPEAVVDHVLVDVALMTDAEAVVEVGWVARHARCIADGSATDAHVLEYFTRKAALLEHIASTQVGDERRETHALATQARAEVAARTAPAPTRAEQLHAIADDLDSTTEAWAAAGHLGEGPEYDAREAVFARLRQWNKANS